MKIYHVTPNQNVQSISQNGIDPSFSQGKLRVFWCCTEAKLSWAIAHIAAKYNMSPEELSVFSANVDSKRLIHTSKRGVYNVRSVVKPSKLPTNAAVIVSADRE